LSREAKPDFISLVKGGVTYRMLSDHLGSVRLVVNTATGAIAQRIDYDEWGDPSYVSGAPDFQPFGFAGGLTDRDTGLVRFGARDYDPQVGRWTSKDPIDFSGESWNLYAYAINDPSNLIDSEGYSHRKPRPSTYNKHSYGESRTKRDRGGEKADPGRRPPRKPPKGWRGPWPPPKGGIPLYYPPFFVPPWEMWCQMFPWDPECQLPPPEAGIPANSCPAG
jgi:RHS repeat-associated protein